MAPLAQRLALSTCWCSGRHTDGYGMLSEIRDLGFAAAELSHGIRVSLVPGIVRAVEAGVVAISSVHNFCPLPSAVRHAAPNLFEPSTRRRAEAASWLRYSRQTIEFAARIGANRVVTHSGSVHFQFRTPHRWLETGPDSVDGVKREAARQTLRRRAARVQPRLIERYAELAEHAAEHGVEVGAENREGVLELPLDDEFPAFFDAFDDESSIRYWHDTGHAERKHRLGLLDHEAHLEALADRLIGFHLHDVNDEGRDHQPPGTGSVDFAMIRRFVRPHHTLVLEPSPRLTRDEIVASRDHLAQALE